MLWVIILHEHKSLIHKLHYRWDCMMLQYAVIASLIQFALYQVQTPDFAIDKSPPHHNKASSMLYSWCDTWGHSFFTNSSPHIGLLSEQKISNFDWSVQRTLFHCSIVQSLSALAHWSLLTSFCFLNSGFLTAILLYRPASQSLLLTVDVDRFFPNN